MGNGQQAILDTCTEKGNTDYSCAKELMTLSFGLHVIWRTWAQNTLLWIVCRRDKRENVLFVLTPEEEYSYFFGSSSF